MESNENVSKNKEKIKKLSIIEGKYKCMFIGLSVLALILLCIGIAFLIDLAISKSFYLIELQKKHLKSRYSL